MKRLFLLLACALVATAASAQDFTKGTWVGNLGIGIGTTYYSNGNYNSKIPPISFSLETCIVDNLFDEHSSIGVGGYVGFTQAKWKYNDNTGYKNRYTVIAARGSFHYQFVNNLDTYATLMMGYRINTYGYYGDWDDSYNTTSSNSGFDVNALVGARYYFAPAFGVFAELGYGGISYFTLGVALRF